MAVVVQGSQRLEKHYRQGCQRNRGNEYARDKSRVCHRDDDMRVVTRTAGFSRLLGHPRGIVVMHKRSLSFFASPEPPSWQEEGSARGAFGEALRFLSAPAPGEVSPQGTGAALWPGNHSKPGPAGISSKAYISRSRPGHTGPRRESPSPQPGKPWRPWKPSR